MAVKIQGAHDRKWEKVSAVGSGLDTRHTYESDDGETYTEGEEREKKRKRVERLHPKRRS